MSEHSALRHAAVFFARDFLSVEFPRMAAAFAGVARVYIVVSEAQARNVRAGDPEGDVICIGAISGDPAFIGDVTASINADRFLRYLDGKEIAEVVSSIAGVCRYILDKYRVAYFLDEPVSGFANALFNRMFAGQGALCLHFQTSWLPGYCFFVSDPAQDCPVPLNLIEGGEDMVRNHIRQREAGLGRPLYVLGYGKLSKRIADLVTTTGKIIYRALFRRGALYIDRDSSAHKFHVRCLWHSLFGRYSPDPAHEGSSKYVIFPLHYEPESLLNYFSDFSRQEEIAAQLLDSLPADYKLVLKEHPSQPGALHLSKWDDLRRADRVVLLRGDYRIADLLAQRPVIVSIGSTFALEAALAGCPVGMLGRTHFQDAPGIASLRTPGEWRSVLGLSTGSKEAMIAWYGAFLNRYCFRGVIMRDQTDIPELSDIVETLDRQREAAKA